MILATKNPHKVAEIRLILAGLPVEVCSLADLGVELSLPEEADTYAGNARSKAVAVATRCRTWALADDSGLEVDALGGGPGVRSHRFSGPEAGDRDNISLLLSRLAGVPPSGRTARFRAAAVLCSPRGEVWVAEGRWEGFIATGPRGTGGFGYDPVFIPRVPHWQGTVAEMEPATKAVFSHRGQAVRALLPALRALVCRAFPVHPQLPASPVPP
ncbi:MAG: non-canonical purine NTP pyrophosphatase [Bacillota bacterium]|nr:non-canonical purine NTP pyrophosphatase [Bacillota bacterium]MDI7250398.1 non-canonical purine NTP pyrophosphatase [Bacillota bacterium]